MPADPRPDVPRARIRVLVDEPPREDGQYVLYWMTSARRTAHSFALDRAVGLALELDLPLLILEGLRVGYEHASDRLHAFVLQGMRANADAAAAHGATYYPYVEPRAGAGQGLLRALAEQAAIVVADDYPTFFLPRMLASAATQLDTRLEAVDANGLLPLSATEHEHRRAYDFRRFLQRELPEHIHDRPLTDPLALLADRPAAVVPERVRETWPPASPELLDATAEALAELPIDHTVEPVASYTGGLPAARARLDAFLAEDLPTYGERRNDLAEGSGASRLSPYLHFGHIGSHEVFEAIVRQEGWTPDVLVAGSKGARAGWWKMSPGAEAYLDQLVTWRELGFHYARHRPDHRTYAGQPQWARTTLSDHANDERPYLYSRAEFDRAETHDELWNAAQRELVTMGRMHNYLRMLWGKKILHWSASAEEAAATMVALNDRYALDGRDPNSYSGIFWVLGRFDRAWGPERPIFGKIRYMSSANTRRKLRVKPYLEQFGAALS